MITFQNVTKNYSSNVGLDNVSVHIEKGDFVFLVGPSGAGKSTFIKLILREINADKGIIMVGDKDVTRLSNREIPMLRRQIGMVFQDFRLLPKKTVYENVAFAMEILHQSKRKIRKRVPQILSLVGISDKADQYPDELSAGEQQRVAIARAIINNPTMLIADEPTGNLDPDTAWEIMDLLKQINMTGTTIVMVTHAKDIVDRMGKRVVAIDHGRIVRDECGAYGFEAENEEPANVDAEEAEFEEEMYESLQEDTEVSYDEIAVDEDEVADVDEDVEEIEASEQLDESDKSDASELPKLVEVESEETENEIVEIESEEKEAEEAYTENEEDTDETEAESEGEEQLINENFHEKLQVLKDQLHDSMDDIRALHDKNNELIDNNIADDDVSGEEELDV